MATTEPAPLPPQRLELEMGKWKTPYTEHQAQVEANRCLFCYDAPCIDACPTSIDIPEFIRRIASADALGAAKTILEANILGLSCGVVCPVEVLCVGKCVYNNMGVSPIQIGKLQHFAVREAYEQGERYWTRGESTGFRVACIGSGPASLAAAHELTRLGHDVVVFEKRALPGGLNTTGVAPYKMMTEESLEEVRYVSEIGFEIRYDVEIGRDVTFETLEAEFDRVFLGVGLGSDRYLELPGQELPGVLGAVDQIESIKNSPAFALNTVQSVVVIGGGNTALDMARQSARLGIPNVTLAYRRDRESMTGYLHEQTAAAQEGVRFLYGVQPMAYLGETALEAVRFRNATAEIDIPATWAVLAIGQNRLEELVQNVGGLVFEEGKVQVAEKTYQTGNPKYYAGGDCVNGGKEVVNAVEHGKCAARAIDRDLRGL